MGFVLKFHSYHWVIVWIIAHRIAD